SLRSLGFYGLVLGWTLIATVVVLPAAVVSGVQFPILIGLLGQGKRAVGRHTGLAYAWNTLGAILGSLAGGFGLIPLLSATGTWRLVVALLAGLAMVSAFVVPRAGPAPLSPRVAAGVAAVIALLMLCAEGPTSAW